MTALMHPGIAAESVVLEVAARTDVGRRRSSNEDTLLCADPCFLVADGMGGHDAGDLASRAAIAAFSEAFTRNGTATLEEIEAALGRARAAVDRVSARSHRGAGCTLTGVIRTTHEGVPHWYVLNVGDSRVYLLRGAELVQLTRDHSLRDELRSEGDPQGPDTPRNVITRALGSEDSRHDSWLLPVETGTRLLVCSDGLTGEVPDERLRSVLNVGGSPAVVVNELLQQALDAGGRDNVTLIAIDVVAGGVATSGMQAERAFAEIDDTLERTLPRRR